MSTISSKASAVGAIILLAMACTISVSAQNQTAGNTSAARPGSIGETNETAVAKKSLSPAEATDLTSGPEDVSEGTSPSEVLDTAKPPAVTIVVTGAADAGAGNERHWATAKATSSSPQTTSPDKWHFQVSPYFWMASLHGTVGIGNLT